MADWAGIAAGAQRGANLEVGTATSVVSAGALQVSVGGQVFDAKALRGVTVSVGDPVLVARSGSSAWAVSATTATTPSAVTSDPSPVPKPASTSGSLVVTPTSTGTWRSEWLDVDTVSQGPQGALANATGAVFYGRAPAALKGATVTSATVQIRRLAGGPSAAAAPVLRLVTEAARPSGPPTLTLSTAGPSLAAGQADIAYPVPTTWAAAIVAGTAGGLAVFDPAGATLLKYAGRTDWAAAWTMTINWTRS